MQNKVTKSIKNIENSTFIECSQNAVSYLVHTHTSGSKEKPKSCDKKVYHLICFFFVVNTVSTSISRRTLLGLK